MDHRERVFRMFTSLLAGFGREQRTDHDQIFQLAVAAVEFFEASYPKPAAAPAAAAASWASPVMETPAPSVLPQNVRFSAPGGGAGRVVFSGGAAPPQAQAAVSDPYPRGGRVLIEPPDVPVPLLAPASATPPLLPAPSPAPSSELALWQATRAKISPELGRQLAALFLAETRPAMPRPRLSDEEFSVLLDLALLDMDAEGTLILSPQGREMGASFLLPGGLA